MPGSTPSARAIEPLRSRLFVAFGLPATASMVAPAYRPDQQGEADALLANDGSYTTTGEMSRTPDRQFTL